MIKEVQLIVSTMNDEEYITHEKMNIKQNAIIINQTNKYEVVNMNNNINYFNMREKGVGLSRSFGLYRADKDIVVFADDDLYFYEKYEKIIKEAYNKYPNVDGIIFNIDNMDESNHKIKKKYKVRWYNFMRFGTARLTMKRNSLIQNRITFSTEFGGGTSIGSGEDTLFIRDCLRKKLSIIAVPISYSKMTYERKSTWFNGYDEKFFIDKGKLFYEISKMFYLAIIIRFAFRVKSDLKTSTKIKLMLKGVKKRKLERK